MIKGIYFEKVFDLIVDMAEEELKILKSGTLSGSSKRVEFRELQTHLPVSMSVYEVNQDPASPHKWYLRVSYPLPGDKNRVTLDLLSKRGTLWKSVPF